MPTPSPISYGWEKLQNQIVKQTATQEDPSEKGQSPLKWTEHTHAMTDLAPTRNLGLIPDTSHIQPL